MAPTETYTLSLHDALPIFSCPSRLMLRGSQVPGACRAMTSTSSSGFRIARPTNWSKRSEEQTSELQSRQYLVCRLLLEKKNSRRLTLHISYELRDHGRSNT